MGLGCRQGRSALASISLLQEEHRAWVAAAPPPRREELSQGPTPCQLSAPASSSPPCKRRQHGLSLTLLQDSYLKTETPARQPGTVEHWGHTSSSLR